MLSDISLITQGAQTNPLQGLSDAFKTVRNTDIQDQQLAQQQEELGLKKKLTEAQLVESKLKNMSERDKARLNSVAIGSAELNSYLQSGDIEGAKSYLMSRRQRLGQQIANGDDVDTTETDQAIKLLDTNPEQLKKITEQGIKLGQLTGALKTQKELSPIGGGNGGVIGQLADRIKASNPDMSDETAIYLAQTGMRQGNTMMNGSISPIPGSLNFAQEKSNATQTGKNTSDLIYKPQIAGKEAGSKAMGEAQATAEVKLPQIVDQTQQQLNLISDIENHPGLKYAVGFSSIAPTIPGTDQANFVTKLDRLKGQNFMQAYNNLKGGGQITEIEGTKAENAIANLSRTQSQQEFKKSLNDLKSVLNSGILRAKKAAKGNSQIPQINASELQPPSGIMLDGNSDGSYSTPRGVKYRVVPQ